MRGTGVPPMAPPAPPQQAGGGFAMPPLPMKPPHLAPPAAAPAPQGKWQKYLPLILVLNGTLLLIVVIVLVFALRQY